MQKGRCFRMAAEDGFLDAPLHRENALRDARDCSPGSDPGAPWVQAVVRDIIG